MEGLGDRFRSDGDRRVDGLAYAALGGQPGRSSKAVRRPRQRTTEAKSRPPPVSATARVGSDAAASYRAAGRRSRARDIAPSHGDIVAISCPGGWLCRRGSESCTARLRYHEARDITPSLPVISPRYRGLWFGLSREGRSGTALLAS